MLAAILVKFSKIADFYDIWIKLKSFGILHSSLKVVDTFDVKKN